MIDSFAPFSFFLAASHSRRIALGVLSASAWVAAGGVSLESGAPVQRVPPFPKSISGIAHVGGTRYWAVADDSTGTEGGLYPCTIEIGPEGTNIVSFSTCPTNGCVRLAGASDLEGCAVDPATGRIWASDEATGTIREYDTFTGQAVRSLAIPETLAAQRPNLGFEALSMRGDGLALWTCTEEALECDGPRASPDAGTTVRFAKFSRRSAGDDFALETIVPYTTDCRMLPVDWKHKARRGVAGLCALPDGSLLVLERELGFGPLLRGMPTFFRFGWSVYRVARPEDATDVTSITSLRDAAWTAVAKELLADGAGLANFEGICLGPLLPGGGQSVLLVSDAGDGISPSMLLPLVLRGLDSGPVATESAAAGDPPRTETTP